MNNAWYLRMNDILKIRKFRMRVVKQLYPMILTHVLLSLYSVLFVLSNYYNV